MTYNWDKTYPNGATIGMDKVDNCIRDIKAGVEDILATEHTVSVGTPTAITAKHKKGSAVAGYDVAASAPATGDGIEEGRLFVESDTNKMRVGNGTGTDLIGAGDSDKLGGVAAAKYVRFMEGTYTGDGTSSRTIAVADFTPKFVTVLRPDAPWDETAQATMIGTAGAVDHVPAALTNSHVVSTSRKITTNGFIVGGAYGNKSGVTYYWFALG